MKDIELPPLPESCQNGNQTTDYFGKLFEYTRQDMRSYARAAVEADMAQRVPDGWKLVPIEPTDRMLNAASLATESEGMVTTPWLRKTIYFAMLASTPAPAQQSGWTEESGLVIDFANRVELSCYDQGSAECMAAVQQILDGKDRGDGVANEPWESIRRRLISLVAPAPAQQEPAEDAGITRGEWIGQAVRVYLAAGDTEADASECAAYLWREQDMADLEDPLEAALSDIEGRPTAQHQDPPQQERKPMTDAEIEDMCGEANRGFCIELEDYKKAVRDTERHHGIKE